MPDPKRVVEIVKARLFEARQNVDLKQEDVAKLAGIDKNHYSQIEQGNTNPTVITLQKIADALEVDVDLLLSSKPIKSKKKD